MTTFLIKKVTLITLLFICCSSSYSEDKAMIVFDASGSMWGQLDGKTKIEIAKDTLRNLISDWDENKLLGLLAYGHRVKGDCKDIQTLVPVGKVDKNSMISIVDKINPKGKTPISAALKNAANQLEFTEDNATIILISDGKETCNADPCSTAAELEKLGVNFTTHVIGFDVDKETGKQLQCIAANTGGQYYPADSAKQLNEALKEVVKLPSNNTETITIDVANLNVESKVERNDIVDGVSDTSSYSAKYDLDTKLRLKGEVLTLIISPRVRTYSEGVETIPLPMPGNWQRKFDQNGKLVDLRLTGNADFFNFRTEGIFNSRQLILEVNDNELTPQKKWISVIFAKSGPIQLEIIINSLSESEINVNFKSLPASEEKNHSGSLIGNGTYNRKTRLLNELTYTEILKYKGNVKRNGKKIIFETKRTTTTNIRRGKGQ